MSYRLMLVMAALLLQGCMLLQEPPAIPAVAPPSPETPLPSPEPPPPLPAPPLAPIVYVPEPAPPPPPAPPSKRPRPADAPEVMIREAHQQARIEPTRRGYFGSSAVHRYDWQPGRIYKVYVSSAQMTKIILPPGELLISKVFLDADAWDVQSYRVGSETQTQDVVFVRPLAAKEAKAEAKDIDVALLTEQGHSFDVHLKVGNLAMFAVTWGAATVPQIILDDALLRSP